MKARFTVTYTNKFWPENFGFRRLKKSSEIAGSRTVHILKNSKPETHPDISLQQFAAVNKDLQQDSFITVVPARKGKAVVVMNMVEYTEKVGGLLNDDNI